MTVFTMKSNIHSHPSCFKSRFPTPSNRSVDCRVLEQQLGCVFSAVTPFLSRSLMDILYGLCNNWNNFLTIGNRSFILLYSITGMEESFNLLGCILSGVRHNIVSWGKWGVSRLMIRNTYFEQMVIYNFVHIKSFLIQLAGRSK